MKKNHETRESVTLHNEGEKLFGIFHKPLVAEPFPAVLICHGLAGHKTGRYRVYVELAEALTAKGIGVLRVDFRGSGDSEGIFSEMTLSSEVSDALVSLKWLENAPGVDKKRIGLFGRSLGGAVAVITAAEFQACKSLALWAPIYSGNQWEEGWNYVKSQNIDPKDYAHLRTINGQVAGVSFFEELFEMSIENKLETLKSVPMLHIHGLKDDIVFPSHAEAYRLKRDGVESKFILLPESDHDFSFMPEKISAIAETAQWFQDTLNGVKTDDNCTI